MDNSTDVMLNEIKENFKNDAEKLSKDQYYKLKNRASIALMRSLFSVNTDEHCASGDPKRPSSKIKYIFEKEIEKEIDSIKGTKEKEYDFLNKYISESMEGELEETVLALVKSMKNNESDETEKTFSNLIKPIFRSVFFQYFEQKREEVEEEEKSFYALSDLTNLYYNQFLKAEDQLIEIISSLGKQNE